VRRSVPGSAYPANQTVITIAFNDAAIRADCELLAAYEPLLTGSRLQHSDREFILKFVLNRRNVVDWPAWAGAWVAGE
jgi:hypothetical protein